MEWVKEQYLLITELLRENVTLVGLTASAFVVFIGQTKYRTYNKRKKWAEVGRGTVVLHTLPSKSARPSLCPFAVKLELFFKIYDIKYVVDTSCPRGSKGKIPWATVNGENLTDSDLIISALRDKCPSYANLTKEQRAQSLFIQRLVDEHLYWGLISWRYLEDPELRIRHLITYYPFYYIPYRLWRLKTLFQKALWLQGLGRHSEDDLWNIMNQDLKALSDCLGTKAFFLGDEPTIADCAPFGQLSQMMWNAQGSPYHYALKHDFKNLFQFCLRLREKFWPDWE